MKHSTLGIMLVTIILNTAGCIESTDPARWNSEKVNEWFEEGQWLGGWQVKPDPSIDRKACAVAYFRNPERWDRAFHFLSSNDLSKLAPERYHLDGDNLYASVSEYLTKNEDDAQYESHRNYIDIQYVIQGKEQIGIAPVSQKEHILEPYNSEKDVELFTVSQGANRRASPESFFIFFPDDAHRPGLKDGANERVKKIVVKLKID
jgi:YhcH/YjgK/YiaL family protein